MATPTSNDLLQMDYVYNGRPFVNVVGKSIDTYQMETIYQAQPFVAGIGATAKIFNEFIALIDSASSDFPGGQENGYLLDELSTSRSITFNEFIYLTDSETTVETGSVDINIYGTVICKVLAATNIYGTTVASVLGTSDIYGTVNSNVLANNLVAVTNASSVDNPTEPTLILNGEVVYSNPSTLPPNGLTNARCYIGYLCNSLFPDQPLSNFFSWNLDMNGGQGTWRTVSNTDFGSMGQEKTIFGILGIINEKGRQKTNGSWGYLNGGIFGSPLLNKPVAFLYANNPQYTTLIPSQSLQLPDPSVWTTLSDATRQIASVAGVTVNWAVPDYPLVDVSFQAGETGIEALESLAEAAGARLRNNGANAYTVVFPNKALGLYEVQDCCIIQSLSHKCNLDIKTGVFNPGVYVFPQYPQVDASTSILPMDDPTVVPQPAGSVDRQVQTIFTSQTKQTDQMPAFTVDLPFDFENVMIQCITVTDGEGIYVTVNDPQRWFLLQKGFAGRYINYHDIGGVLQPQLTIDWTLFPQNNTDVDDGNFILKIGVITKQLSGNFDTNQQLADQQEKQVVSRTWLRYRFIPVCTYNITVVFSGTLPMPGMAIKATIGDYTIGENGDVIIESWSFSNPGILSITAVQWAEIQYYANYTGELI